MPDRPTGQPGLSSSSEAEPGNLRGPARGFSERAASSCAGVIAAASRQAGRGSRPPVAPAGVPHADSPSCSRPGLPHFSPGRPKVARLVGGWRSARKRAGPIYGDGGRGRGVLRSTPRQGFRSHGGSAVTDDGVASGQSPSFMLGRLCGPGSAGGHGMALAPTSSPQRARAPRLRREPQHISRCATALARAPRTRCERVAVTARGLMEVRRV